jgi:hypothetical protein
MKRKILFMPNLKSNLKAQHLSLKFIRLKIIDLGELAHNQLAIFVSIDTVPKITN